MTAQAKKLTAEASRTRFRPVSSFAFRRHGKALTGLAGRNGRSMNAEIVHAPGSVFREKRMQQSRTSSWASRRRSGN